ncbi:MULTISPECIES: hypothetical protein [unclassified Methylobacterium]|jgi:hypothetical protein|uniref:hypothetical protein n=1 Tax=unclassified Methylobacterium TaxID=2615210 RepID=UPI0006F65B47|nr:MULTISPECIES: hypothetical protein [unclassified Methylobacterium]KQO49135.1 hypothetical protein ASF24_08090 [Methylobacterium sp. Leaf86]KQP00632.1 hypothetical protein ASF32_01805 [Methylobacterium sp. Leaf91]MBO1019420.1 hypothetical protein [Methylobacterium sp. SD274]
MKRVNLDKCRSSAAAAVACAILWGAPAHADVACARDVLVANSMQRQAIDQLEQADGDDANRCRVWRRHVETMRRVSSVYGRCLSGAERAAKLNEVQTSEKDFSGLIRTRCRGL